MDKEEIKNDKVSAYNRYMWLISILSEAEDGLSLAEIKEAWKNNSLLNKEGHELSDRTFYNHLHAIEKQMNVTIDSQWETDKILKDPEKKVNKYSRKKEYVYKSYKKFYLNKDKYRGLFSTDALPKKTTEKVNNNATIISAKSMLGNVYEKLSQQSFEKLRKRVIFDDFDPKEQERYLDDILLAMRDNRMIEIRYRLFGSKGYRDYLLEPYCLKRYKTSWYLLANNILGYLRIYPLNKSVVQIWTLKEYFEYPLHYDPQEYFNNAFGWEVDNEKIEEVILKSYGREMSNLRWYPLHHTQEEVESGKDYRIFKLKIYPYARDFIKELFSKIDQIEVIAPQELREIMITYINRLKARYE